MLAQPKSLVVAEGSAPRLEWWPGLDAWLGEETEEPTPHAVGDVVLSGRPVEITLRTAAAATATAAAAAAIAAAGGDRPADGDRPAVVVGCDGKNLWVTGPEGTRLGETVLAEPATSLRILTIGEYVEVYADGVFALTTLCYSGHADPLDGRDGRARGPGAGPPGPAAGPGAR